VSELYSTSNQLHCFVYNHGRLKEKIPDNITQASRKAADEDIDLCSIGKSGIFAFDLKTGKLVPVHGKRHFLNALIVDREGNA
jgi:hypothetical protein